MNLEHWLGEVISENRKWSDTFGRYRNHNSISINENDFVESFRELVDRLKDNYPFFHPCYAGQMLKPPHPAAIVGYLAGMLINPNNHAKDGGPATAAMEAEVVQLLAHMFGFDQHLGHLTTSGTIANLEALFVARELHPNRGIAYSEDAHYTHKRVCHLLGLGGHPVVVDAQGRMDLNALETLLRTGKIGTVVLTAGTTGLGAIDPIHDALTLCSRYDARVHVDAAYGGFFTLLAGRDGVERLPEADWQTISRCDSVVVDPHKHGLQPYGCGCVLFRDPSVGRFYLHDSPYTYFTSDELHLGQISIECSRAGAAAAALWLTFQVLPPTQEGLGNVLAAGRRAALRWAALIERSDHLTLYQQPDLDILTYFPTRRPSSLSKIDRESERVFRDGMKSVNGQVYLSTLSVTAQNFSDRHRGVVMDADGSRILRSVLMKPESEIFVEELHSRVVRLAAQG
ncbi:pyridoxal phosphate-dependent decarboxylase family protein [Paraburkholderia humisilvae]|uniref:Histidine decarboxylase n=1 Tax=Paraburkholderia humisilvae TaxID=627669 RepID=A0A6J5FB82_9BURK|nr:aminotransferase class V-fold PLP-dependent enzyme [Paraburkholderia humisilvae]CAB3774475.1 Histidine decarboxylase [Paraburkholderia humisilvae]